MELGEGEGTARTQSQPEPHTWLSPGACASPPAGFLSPPAGQRRHGPGSKATVSNKPHIDPGSDSDRTGSSFSIKIQKTPGKNSHHPSLGHMPISRLAILSCGCFCPSEYLAMSGEVFCCHDWRGQRVSMGIQWVDARNAAQQPTAHRTMPTTKNHPNGAVSSAEGQQGPRRFSLKSEELADT